MSGVVLNKEIYARVLKRLRQEFAQGRDEDKPINFSRTARVCVMEESRRFWQERLPEIDPDHPPDQETLCMHAICTTALENIKRTAANEGIE